MLDIKLHRYLINHIRVYILALFTSLLFNFGTRHRSSLHLISLQLLFLFVLLPYVLNLTPNHLVQIDQQLPLESLRKQPQGIANLNLGNFGRKMNISVTLKQNHSDLVLPPLIPGNQTRTSNRNVSRPLHQFQLFHQLRIIRQRRISTRV